MKTVSIRSRRDKIRPLLEDACIGCGKEPARKGQMGDRCKRYRSYHDVQSHEEFAAYLDRLDTANRRVTNLLGRGRKTVVHRRRRA